MDEANVTIDLCAVSEGFNVCGVDTPGLSQVTRSEAITHWKQTFVWRERIELGDDQVRIRIKNILCSCFSSEVTEECLKKEVK